MNKSAGLLNAVALAAFGLLVLKVVGLVAVDRSASPKAPAVSAAQSTQSKYPLATAIARARAPDTPFDPMVTGSTAAPGEAKAQNGAKPAAPAGSATDSLPNLSANRAGIMDGRKEPSDAERALLESLTERRGQLEERSSEIETRERLLQGAEQRLENRIGELKSIEERLSASAKQREEAEKASLKNLVTMYEVMKPKDAAQIFDRLAHDVLVPVVMQMNPRKMSEILAVMSPEAAEKLTIALAQQARGGDGRVRMGQSGGTALPPTELPALDLPTR